MPIEIPTENWPGEVVEVTLGATADMGGTRSKVVKVGGAKTLPFLQYEAKTPNLPVIALEIKDSKPDGWSPILLEEFGDVMNDPGTWAKAAEDMGVDLIQLSLSLKDEDGNPNTADKAVAATMAVLENSSLPLIVFGTGQTEIDNEMLVPVSDAAKGERLVLGLCEDKNYRTIVASAMANDHLVTGRAPMDVNLSKQLNILITDMGMTMDRILLDPTTGALGYGIEYGYSVMERLRLAALQGDKMTQSPMIVTTGYETWKTKESKVGTDVPAEWGEWKSRGINWETMTAIAQLESGADIVILRHPESVKRVRAAIQQLYAVTETA